MFDLVFQGSKPNSRLSLYSVRLPDEYTVKSFIAEVLREHSDAWGSIGIFSERDTFLGSPRCQYAHGDLVGEVLPESILEKKVVAANAQAGWFTTDYVLILEGQEVLHTASASEVGVQEILDFFGVSSVGELMSLKAKLTT